MTVARRPLALAALASLVVIPQARAADVPAVSRVAAVTVYPGWALVERTADVSVPAGASEVILDGLPATLDASSLSASGEGSFTIEGVEVRRVQTPVAGSPRVRELEERVAAWEERLAAVDEEIANLEETRKFLVRLGERSREGANRDLESGRLPASEIAGMAEAFAATLRTTSAGLLDARGRRRTIARDLDAARRELRELVAASQRETVAAAVSVSAAAAGRARIRLRYLVRGATWEPAYDARADLDRGEVRLTYAAMVRQATGEDWEDVEVTLSTARPSVGASVADPDPWFLEPRRPVVMARSMRERTVGAAAPEAMLAEAVPPLEGAPAPPPPSAEVAEAEVVAGVHASYRIGARTTVRSDNRPRKVVVLDRAFAATFRHRAVPERAERAHVVARFPNRSDVLFLAGEVRAYQGADFVGAGRIESVAPGDTFEVQLGPDPAVDVVRTVVREMTDPTRSFGGGKVRVDRRYRIEVENRRSTPVVIDVLDRVPVSRHDEIVVTRARGTEPTEAREDGILRWEVSLAPGEKRTIEHGYRIERPEGMDVGGL